ncbi:50S ribosomal protein L18 [Parcubacteria bacterium DG_72]|nr:MAG: 50S ribosomal protein L18 [Parcubacteria bacterium DG_72]
MLEKQEKRIRRHKKVRAKIKGTNKVPRLCVFRSNKYIYVQLIDDETGKTLASASSELKKADKVGKDIAKKAEELKIKKVVFDRGGYKYHGRIKALADAAREAGLKF